MKIWRCCFVMLVAVRAALPAAENQASAPATISFADNGQKLGTGDSWYVQLVDINGDGQLEA